MFKRIIPIIAVTLLSSACHKSQSESESEAQTVDVALPVVDTITLASIYPAYLSANASVNVVARVNGELLSKNFTSGTMVKQGDVLFTIDPSTYRDQLQQSQASLTTAISNRDYALEHYDAVKKALESEAVSKMEVEQAKSAYEQAEASIRNARAAVETARRNLGYCTITAPISGMVDDNTMSVGNYVSGGGSPVVLTTIYDITSVSANFAIEDERYQEIVNARDSKENLNFDSIPITFEDHLPHVYTGAFSYLAPSLSNSTGTMTAKCKIQNPYGELRPGMYVKVALPYAKLPNAILVKDASLGSDQLGKYLYVVNDSNKVVYTPVTVGDLYADTMRVVTKGLKPTDRYVTKALLKVRDGMKVDPRMTK